MPIRRYGRPVYLYRYRDLATQAINKPLYIPTPKQQIFEQSSALEVLYSGAVRAGKSRGLMEKAYKVSLAFPGVRLGVFRKVRKSLEETTIRSWLVDVNGWKSVENPGGNRGAVRDWKISKLKATMLNGSEILFFGMDKLTKIGSLELGGAFVDEAHELEQADWDMIQTRLNQQGMPCQLWGACNPASPRHWLYLKFFRDQAEGTEVIQTSSLENPHLEDSYKERLSRLRGNFYKRMVLGLWVGFSGLIYDCWSDEENMVDSLPDGWQDRGFNFRAVDFGGANPHVCQWWHVEPNPPDMTKSKMYRYREVYWSGIATSDFATMIKDHSPASEKIVYTVCDHELDDRKELHKLGIRTVPAYKSVQEGINETYHKISNRELLLVRNALVESDPQLTDDTGPVKRQRPTCTEEEIFGYEWDYGVNVVKDQPKKEDDHGMDDTRYAVMSLKYGVGRRWSSRRGV